MARGLLDSLSERKLRPLAPEQRAKEERLLGMIGKLDEQIMVLDKAVASDQPNPMGASASSPGERPENLQPASRVGHNPRQSAASRPGEEDHQKRSELRERRIRERDGLKAEYARFEQEILGEYGARAGEVYSLARIQAQIASDEAMVSWVDVKAHPQAKDASGEHWACVVRHSGNTKWLRLPGRGDKGAWSQEDDDLPEQVRGLLSARHSGERERSGRLAALYEQRMRPVEEYLKGTPVRHLIVLPAGRMAGIPVEALAKEDYTVSYAPSGTMYAWLCEQRHSREAQAGLLVLGDPVFGPQIKSDARGSGTPERALKAADTAPDAVTEAVGAEQELDAVLTAAARGNVFAQLPGTRVEVEAIAGLCERLAPTTQVTRLLGRDASRRKLEELALSGRLGQFRFVHLATHARMDDRAPMRSALILCQDDPNEQLNQALAGQDACNGRLSADQIVRSWHLDAELVTLSGCETAGRAVGGEGYLGFSQALFVAGARSLLLSLWKVDDTATALLMMRFYENLFGGNVETPGSLRTSVSTMRKTDALCDAKRWLRTLTAEQIRGLCGKYGLPLPSELVRGDGGSTSVTVPTPCLFGQPYYWSAFILIGDPD